MSLGDLVIEMHEYDHPAGKARVAPDTTFVGCVHIAVAVDDIQSTYEGMVAAGVDFISPPQAVTEGKFEGFIGAYCRDPDGYIIELNEAPADPPELSELTTTQDAA
jgi:catechol 2,3-dioxygenase-like lactoylglutathione lyase family enzyme